MKEFTKKVLLVGLTLSLIGAGSALLIGGTNLITKDRIAENEAKSADKAKKDIFGDGEFISIEFEKENYTYVQEGWKVLIENIEVGYIFKTSGKNAYGEVSMMVGISDKGIGNISLITNTETYGDKLVDDYLSPYLDGESSLDDVSCGATYGAKLIRDMANEAYYLYKEIKGGN